MTDTRSDQWTRRFWRLERLFDRHATALEWRDASRARGLHLDGLAMWAQEIQKPKRAIAA